MIGAPEITLVTAPLALTTEALVLEILEEEASARLAGTAADALRRC